MLATLIGADCRIRATTDTRIVAVMFEVSSSGDPSTAR
jgi:hypothetical protein